MQRLLIAFTSVAIVLIVATAVGQKSLPSDLPSSDAGETAELELYRMATQIGTIARRTIRDRAGRIAREVYYTSNGAPLAAPGEKDLRIQSIRVYFNDTSGRVDHVEHWDAARRLARVEQNAYDASGKLARKWYVEADGVKRYELRFRDSSTVSELYFDDTGAYLKSLRGELVSDIDLPHGWGATSGGMACGITLSTERGRFNEFKLIVNIKNVAADYLSIDSLATPVFQLVNASGQAVPLRKSPGSKDGPQQLYGQGLKHDEAGYLYPGYRLSDYFDLLPPGQYTIRILQPVPERQVVLSSNEVNFVVW